MLVTSNRRFPPCLPQTATARLCIVAVGIISAPDIFLLSSTMLRNARGASEILARCGQADSHPRLPVSPLRAAGAPPPSDHLLAATLSAVTRTVAGMAAAVCRTMVTAATSR